MIIYQVIREYNVQGDYASDVILTTASKDDAMRLIADEVRNDLAGAINWADRCEWSEALDENEEEISDWKGKPIEKLSSFTLQEKEEWQGEYYERYYIERHRVEMSTNPLREHLCLLTRGEEKRLLEMVRDYVLAKQGGKGFILTDDRTFNKAIWAETMAFFDGSLEDEDPLHCQVKAVRARGQYLEILCSDADIPFTYPDVRVAAEEEWIRMMHDERCLSAVQTLLSVATSIAAFADSEPENGEDIEMADWRRMEESLLSFIRLHQGERGFINTEAHGDDGITGDILYALVWDGYEYDYTEKEVKAVRAKGNSIEVIADFHNVRWDDGSIAGAKDEDWMDIHYDERILFIQTLFNIAENIREYSPGQ